MTLRHRSVNPMRSVGFLLLVGALAFSSFFIHPLFATPKQLRPNIILVMTDDQGYGEMSCHGNPFLKTPNLDRLHAQSVRLTDFHVSPTCAPTRAALLTGRHEFRTGVTHTIFERERPNLGLTLLPRYLQRAGYQTGIFGKWHLGDELPYQPENRGFGEVFIHGGGGIGQTYPGSCGDAPSNSYHRPIVSHNQKFVRTDGYCTDVFIDASIRWMAAQHSRGAPFFAYITPNAPHAPLVSPGAEWEAPYRNRGLSDLTVRYYAMIAHFDAALGRLMDWLRMEGLERDTLLIFMTDNGHSLPDAYNSGMRGMKGTPYQGGTRVPSFWRWLGHFPEGLDIPALTAHLDVLPTLLELTEISVPRAERKGWEGRSLLPLFRNPRTTWANRYLITHAGRWEAGHMEEHRYQQCSIRDQRFRWVNGEALYDLANDPGESRNVATEYPRVVARLSRIYSDWWVGIKPAAQQNEWVRGPSTNPFKERYWQQEGGAPEAWMKDRMNPDYKFDPERPPM